MPELYDLVLKYEPQIIWSDGDAGPDAYWESTKFLAWLYNESPVRDTVVTNDRWGDGCSCHHGGYYTCVDRYNPGKLIDHKWENCMTLDKKSWGFRREARLGDVMSTKELIGELISTVAYGGNILINVGPTAWGTIDPIYEERLLELGAWLNMNGQAIYGTRPWRVQHEEKADYIWYTSTPDSNSSANVIVFAILTQWPSPDTTGLVTVFLPSVKATKDKSQFFLIDGSPHGQLLDFEPQSAGEPGVTVVLNNQPRNPAPQFMWAWAMRMLFVS